MYTILSDEKLNKISSKVDDSTEFMRTFSIYMRMFKCFAHVDEKAMRHWITMIRHLNVMKFKLTTTLCCMSFLVQRNKEI